MTLSAITGSVIIQFSLLLIVRGYLFFPNYDPANWLYIGTLGEFFEDLLLGTIWVVVFHEWFSGQFFIFVGLTILLIYSVFLARRMELRFRSLILFHVTSLMWILLPVVALKLGSYSGP